MSTGFADPKLNPAEPRRPVARAQLSVPNQPSNVPRMINDETGEPVCDQCKGARTETPAINEGQARTLGWIVDGKANAHICPQCKPAAEPVI